MIARSFKRQRSRKKKKQQGTTQKKRCTIDISMHKSKHDHDALCGCGSDLMNGRTQGKTTEIFFLRTIGRPALTTRGILQGYLHTCILLIRTLFYGTIVNDVMNGIGADDENKERKKRGDRRTPAHPDDHNGGRADGKQKTTTTFQRILIK